MSSSEELFSDPDYVSATSNDQIQQKIYEETARKATAQKITAIVEREFSKEIEVKEREIFEIHERLQRALKIFHLLRYGIVTKFYNRKQCQAPEAAETKKQTRIHPAIKSVIGKRPKSDYYTDHAVPSTSTDPRFLCDTASFASKNTEIKQEETANKCDAYNTSEGGRKRRPEDDEVSDSRPRKVPRYVPPKSSAPEKACPSRSNSQKVCKRVVVGNISRWIPPDWREDSFSHKWTMYVRGEKDDGTDISAYVSKVRFFLHPSYHPNDIVEVTSYPFHLTRRGWGEFPLRVQLHFENPRNKPVNIIHNLKLDRTYTGLQTLGSETLVDVWIYAGELPSNVEQIDNDGDKHGIIEDAFVKVESGIENDSSSTFSPEGKKDPASTSWISASTPELIRIKRETTEANESSDGLSNAVGKSENNGIKVEPDDASAEDATSDSNQEEITCLVEHDHNYFSRQSSPDNCVAKEENNVTTNHFATSSECASSTDLLSMNSEEKRNRLNGVVQSSGQYLASSRAASIADTMVRGNPLDARESSKTSERKTFENLAGDTSMTINGYCKPTSSEASLDWLNGPQRATSSSNSRNLHLKPLKISIPSNVFVSSNNKRVVLVQDKSILMKPAEKKLDGAKLSSARDGNVAKLNIRVPPGVSILKKNAGANAAPLLKTPNERRTIMLKGANSVLLSANENVPILKIADPRGHEVRNVVASSTSSNSSIGKQEFYARSEEKAVTQRPKITLGKDRHKIQSKRELYMAALRSIDTANIAANDNNTEALIRFIIRRLPIVTENARDPEYKQLHPYACRSVDEYLGHNVGKQRALEWCRARTIKHHLRKKQIPIDRMWSVKEIMMWARVHGYTPSKRPVPSISTCNSRKTPNIGAMSNVTASPASTYTEPVALHEWLTRQRQSSSHQSTSARVDVEEIDVEETDDSPTDRGKNSGNRTGNNRGALIPLELDRNLLPLHKFVCDTARDIGIAIGSEEIVPGVLHCAASRMMMRVVECFVEDLTRSSFAKSLERNNGDRCSVTITPNDVRNALSSREEFDIFTNDGLGSRQLSTTELANL